MIPPASLRRAIFAAVLGFSLIAGAWRFHDLDRDPDIVTQSSQESWGDPAFYLYNARSRALFGDWRADEGLSMYVTPGYALLTSLWLEAFGVRFNNAVILSILAGFAFVAATAFLCEFSARVDGLPPFYSGLAAASMLLSSYILFVFQRVPNADMETIAVCCLGALFLGRLQILDPQKQPLAFRLSAVWGGLGIGLAPFMKLHGALFSIGAVVAWVASYFLLADPWRTSWQRAVPYLIAGLAAALAVWLGWFGWLFSAGYAQKALQEFEHVRKFSTLTAATADTLRPAASFSFPRFFYSNLFYRQPLETILGALGFWGFITAKRRNWPMLLAGTWLVVEFVAIAGITIDPLRYRLLAWPPIVMFAADYWTRQATAQEERLSMLANLAITAGAGLVACWVTSYFVVLKVGGGTISPSLWLLLFGGCAACVHLLLRLIQWIRPRNAALIFAVVLLTLSLPEWIKGERNASHEMADAAHWLDRYPNAVLGGGWGVRLGFSSERNAYFYWTPAALRSVTLSVEDSVYNKDIPLPWHDAGRYDMRRVPLSIEFAEIQRLR